MKKWFAVISMTLALYSCALNSTLGDWTEEEQLAFEYSLDVAEGEQE